MSADVRVIVITGTMGSGKTTVLAEASDILTARGIEHAAVDLDALGMAYLPGATSVDLAYRNLASLWKTYAGLGITRLLLAAAIESAAELSCIRAVVPDCRVVVGRLTARLETMQQRVSVREPGMLHDALVARVTELEASLDRARVEDFTVPNDDRSVTDAAMELLTRAGWI